MQLKGQGTDLAMLIRAGQRTLMVGPPATMKTSLWHEAAATCDMDIITSTPGIDDRCDYKGGMVPDLKSGYMRELPLETIHRLLNIKKPTIWFLDDLGNGTTEVQAGIKGLITKGGPLDRSNPNIYFCAATNRVGDKTGVNSLHEALRSEFDRSYLMPTPGAEEKADGGVLFDDWYVNNMATGPTGLGARWLNWAMDNDFPAEIIAYHRATACAELYKWKPHADPSIRMPDLRTWHAAARSWNAGLRSTDDIASNIGKPAAAPFITFAKRAGKCPHPDKIRADPKGTKVPEDPGDIYFVVACMVKGFGKDDFEPWEIYSNRMPRIYDALLFRDCYRRAPDLGEGMANKFAGSRSGTKWFLRNQELFSTAE